ncbi:GreA/GreB family elongation factor [Carboxylicivirga caseinilyticus]|uniref:GreA/GreB family elongation factor n=1 Tax=Carboxylicivirga caseinilyticus TaxID=3417572 RepID=UPI003D332CFF|nr:GreA/GreB family elongation factor [Marinilabiliaceae bacterium A049]
MEQQIKITELDYLRLSNLIGSAKKKKSFDLQNIEALAYEIKRAEKVDSKKISSEFVTMNSIVQVESLDTKKQMKVKIVYPKDADFSKGHVSVLSPLGSALLGYKLGDTVQFNAPRGIVSIKILAIDYQPEANGAYTM